MTHTGRVMPPIKRGTARRLGIRWPYAVLAQRWITDTCNVTLTAEQVDFLSRAYSGPPWRLRQRP